MMDQHFLISKRKFGILHPQFSDQPTLIFQAQGHRDVCWFLSKGGWGGRSQRATCWFSPSYSDHWRTNFTHGIANCLNHKVQTDNKHCATLARIFNQGTAIAKQNQHFILSDNLYHISDWEAESVKDLPPEPTHDETWIMWCITLRYPL